MPTAPAVHADDPTDNSAAPTQTMTFNGDYSVEGDANMFLGNCFNTGNINADSRQHRDCGVERAAYNFAGAASTRYTHESLFLGNRFNARGGTINLAGGVYEGNHFVADRVIIRGNALFVSRNTFEVEGEGEVEDPDQVAGEIYLGDVTDAQADRISADVLDLQRCTGELLSAQNFDRLEVDGEIANPTRNGEVGIHNLIAASNSTDEYGRCADELRENDFAHNSAIATVNGPQNNTSGDTITHADLELFYQQLHDCRVNMEISRPNGPGTAVKALFDCGEAKLVVTKEPSKDTPPDHDEL